jgi:hypothetical protein
VSQSSLKNQFITAQFPNEQQQQPPIIDLDLKFKYKLQKKQIKQLTEEFEKILILKDNQISVL